MGKSRARARKLSRLSRRGNRAHDSEASPDARANGAPRSDDGSSRARAAAPDRGSFLRTTVPVLVVLLGLCVWVHRYAIAELVWAWQRNPQYSHGFLVPLMAGYIAWTRRERLRQMQPRMNAWGLPLIAAGLALGLVGTYAYYGTFEQLGLVISLGGIVLLAFGGRVGWVAAPAVGFLVFMVPLPYSLESMLGGPLQALATKASAYGLQALGQPAVAEGNTVLLGEHTLDVEQACTGLRMLMSFGAISVLVALVIKRPWWDRLVIVASAVPVALAANILRIIVTGVLIPLVGAESAQVFFHDVAGYLMMPLALVMLLVELWVLSKILVPVRVDPDEIAAAVGLGVNIKAKRKGRKGDKPEPEREAVRTGVTP